MIQAWDVEPSDARPDGRDREEDQALPERPDRRGMVVDRRVAAATGQAGRKCTTGLREVVNAIRHMVRSRRLEKLEPPFDRFVNPIHEFIT